VKRSARIIVELRADSGPAFPMTRPERGRWL